MKSTCNKFLALALTLGLTLAVAQRSSADLLVGWNNFDGTQGPEVEDHNTSGGLITPNSLIKVGTPGVFAGAGSNDLSYGTGFDPITFDPLPIVPGSGNGWLRLLDTTTKLVFRMTVGPQQFYLINTFFDAISINPASPPNTLSLSYSINNGPSVNYADLVNTIPTGPNPGNWPDFIALSNIYIAPNSTIAITFSTASARDYGLDNIAFDFVAVPEPGNVIGLTALLGSTLVMRNRRRKPVTVIA